MCRDVDFKRPLMTRQFAVNVCHVLAIISGILSRGKPTYLCATYNGRNAQNAVDGNYSNTDPNSCATAVYNSSAYGRYFGNVFLSLSYSTWWFVDLGHAYAVLHVIMYNAAFLPGGSILRSYIEI